jgi:hypothetical protein
MLFTYNDLGLKKHRINRSEVDDILDETSVSIECALPPSKRGNDRIMLVGFTSLGRLLEIGLEFFEDSIHVFHANDATQEFRIQFENRVSQ